MKTKQEKLEYIYEKIANKDLTFWCRVIIETTWIKEWYIWIIYRYGTLIYDLSGDIEELDLLWHNECYLSSGRCIINDIDFSDFKYFDWLSVVWESEKKKDTTYLYKIIWHPVMIWDVIDFIKKNNIKKYILDSDSCFWILDISQYIFKKLWEKLTDPIEEQSDECIDCIYDLFQEE